MFEKGPHQTNSNGPAAVPADWQKKSRQHLKAYRHLLERSSRKELLAAQGPLHEKATRSIDCLQCAQCCKGYSPRFKTPDIKRISRHLELKESVFIEKYLKLDEEGDYVTQHHPCPFLGPDNRCQIYEQRPSDCARFPYSDEDVLFKRPALTLMNASFCPIVYVVLEGLLDQLAP